MLSKAVYRFNVIPIKIPIAFFLRKRKLHHKFIWYIKGLQIAKTIWKKNKVGDLILPDIEIYYKVAAAAAKSLQSCPTLCDTIDGSPPGSPIPGILQARTLEWVAISFSNAWEWKVKVKPLSHVRLFETLWTAAYQAPPSTGFSRQEHWSGVPFPSPMHESEKWKGSCSVVSDS